MTQEFDSVDPVAKPPTSDTVSRVVRSHPDTRQKKQFEAALKKKLEEEKKKQEERLRQDSVEIGGRSDDDHDSSEADTESDEQKPTAETNAEENESSQTADESREDHGNGLDIKA